MCVLTSIFAMTGKLIIAPYGSWKTPPQGATVYENTSTIYDLLVDELGELFHIEESRLSRPPMMDKSTDASTVPSCQSREVRTFENFAFGRDFTVAHSSMSNASHPAMRQRTLESS